MSNTEAAEDALYDYASTKLTTAVMVSGLGWAGRTIEARLMAGELVASQRPRLTTPVVRFDRRQRKLAAIISSRDYFSRLVVWLYVYPQISTARETLTSRIHRYAEHERCSIRTAWRRREELIKAVEEVIA